MPTAEKSALRTRENGPRLYDAALIERILSEMSRGVSLRQICRAEGYPDESTVRQWAINDVEGFAARYAKAREAQMDAWADEILDISDDGSNDWKDRETKDGRIVRVLDDEHIQRSRLRVDARKWLMAKIAPKKYADRIEAVGAGGEPLIPADTPARELAKAVYAILQEAARPKIDGAVEDAETVEDGEDAK